MENAVEIPVVISGLRSLMGAHKKGCFCGDEIMNDFNGRPVG